MEDSFQTYHQEEALGKALAAYTDQAYTQEAVAAYQESFDRDRHTAGTHTCNREQLEPQGPPDTRLEEGG